MFEVSNVKHFFLSIYFQVVPVVSASELTAMNGKESLWIDRGWRVADTDKDSGVSEAKLLVNNPSTNGTYTDGGTDYAEVDTRNMSTFYNCRKVSGGEGGFHRIEEEYLEVGCDFYVMFGQRLFIFLFPFTSPRFATVPGQPHSIRDYDVVGGQRQR